MTRNRRKVLVGFSDVPDAVQEQGIRSANEEKRRKKETAAHVCSHSIVRSECVFDDDDGERTVRKRATERWPAQEQVAHRQSISCNLVLEFVSPTQGLTFAAKP